MTAAPWCGYTTLSPTSNDIPLPRTVHRRDGPRVRVIGPLRQLLRASVVCLRMDAVGLLARSELFSAFGPDALERVAAAARLCQFSRNQVVFSEGDEAGELYVVQ